MTGNDLKLNIIIDLKDNVKMVYDRNTTADCSGKVIMKLLTSVCDEICFAPQHTKEWTQIGGIKKWVSYQDSIESEPSSPVDEAVCLLSTVIEKRI